MATSSFSLFSLLFLLSQHTTFASHHHHRQPTLKTLKFTLFQQETVNKTGFLIITGVEAGTAPKFALPIGSMAVSQDPLTLQPNASSKVAGVLEGIYVASTLDGLRSLSILTLILNVKGHQGSVSILGSVHNTKPALVPVVGGTDDFLFVQGYVRYSPYKLKPPCVTYELEFNLFWPPYATAAGSY